MGLFICELCDKPLLSSEGNHVCNHENVKNYIHSLKDKIQKAEWDLSQIKDSIVLLLKSVGDIEDLEPLTVIRSQLLKDLWMSAKCQWYDHKTPESFTRMYSTHLNLLRSAFNLFRSKSRPPGSFLDKLIDLKKACEDAKIVLGYQSSILDITPEDLLK